LRLIGSAKHSLYPGIVVANSSARFVRRRAQRYDSNTRGFDGRVHRLIATMAGIELNPLRYPDKKSAYQSVTAYNHDSVEPV
jgi:hypothetical protein